MLSKAPDYTDVLVFTDEPGDDINLAGAVTALALSKHSQINVIWTETARLKTLLLFKIIVKILKNLRHFSTAAPDLKLICSQTGGLFIEISKVDVEDIVNLLSQSIKTSQATLSYTTELSGATKTKIFVDNSLMNIDGSRVETKVSGSLSEVSLRSPNSMIYFETLHFVIHILFCFR